MSQNLKGCLWMIGAILWFSMLAVASRQVGTSLDPSEILLYRSLIGSVCVIVICAMRKQLHSISYKRLDLHFVRNLAHFVGQNLWLFALHLITLAQLFAIEFTSPIWVIFLSALLLKEPLTRIKLFSGALGFIGVCIVANPWGGNINAGLITAAISAVCFAFTAVYTKKLTNITNTATILFWLCLFQSVMGLGLAGFDGDIALPQNNIQIFWLCLVAMSGLTAHFCLTKALSLAPATLVMPIDFGRLPLIAIVGAIFYNEPLDMMIFIGAALIFAANYINITSQNRKKNPIATSP